MAGPIVYTLYDAEGRNRETGDAQAQRSSSQWHSGDGQSVKRAVWQSGVFTEIEYFVRSSVLGGAAVVELNQAGQKKHGYVYLGGEVIAEQGATTSAFAFRHSDPLTADRGGTAPGLAFWTAIKADPTGVNVGVADPFDDPDPPGFDAQADRPMLFRMFDQTCSVGNPTCRSCSLDGFSVGCERVAHLLDIGAARPCPDNDCGPRVTTVTARGHDGRVIGSSSIIRLPGQPGWDGSLDGTYSANPIVGTWFNVGTTAGASSFLNFLAVGPSVYGNSFIEFVERVSGGGDSPYVQIASLNGIPSPQNPTPTQQNPCAITTQLPESGSGFVAKQNTQRHTQFGIAQTISQLMDFAATWAQAGHGNALRIGEISIQGGGRFGEQRGQAHARGVGIDIGLFRLDRKDLGTTYQSGDYDEFQTRDLVHHLLDNPDVARVIFADPYFKGHPKFVRETKIHHNHIHVEFVNPCR